MKKIILFFLSCIWLLTAYPQDNVPYVIGYGGTSLKTAGNMKTAISGGSVVVTDHRNINDGRVMAGFRGDLKYFKRTFEKDLFVSKGYYASFVELKWEVIRYADQIKRFNIWRKKYATSEDSVLVGSIAGTERVWKDEYAESGVLYKYTLYAEGITKNFTEPFLNLLEGVGFRFPSGRISGRVTYKGGTAVQGVNVYAETEDKLGGKSILLNGTNAYLAYSHISDDPHYKFDTAFCFQGWFKPGAGATSACLFEKGTQYKLKYLPGTLTFTGAGTAVSLNFPEKPDTFFHVSAMFSGDSLKLYVLYNATTWWKSSVKINSNPNANTNTFFIGKSSTGEFFKGNVDEIRIWQRSFSDQLIIQNAGVYIAGTEKGITAYYRCDEGMGTYAYDLSRSGFEFNEHHIFISHVQWSNEVPLLAQLAYKGITDENGNYIISGIPYATNGSNYRITPVFEVHKFDPTESLLFIGEGSVTHNGINFTDVSSFPVRGNVKYRHTNFPVAGVTLIVDGRTAVTADGTPVTSDANGNFTVDVPIGRHYVSLAMHGHGFENAGRYPAPEPGIPEPLKEFQEPISGLQFIDTTLIKVIGRVTGGPLQAAKIDGLGLTLNNIGNASIIFSTQKQNDLSDSKNDTSGTWNQIIFKDSLKAEKGKTKWNIDKLTPKQINIHPDTETGEYVAWLLPEKYTVTSVEAGNYVFGEEHKTVLDLTSAFSLKTNKDSVFTGIKVSPTGAGDTIYRIDSVRFQAEKAFIYREFPMVSVTAKNGYPIFSDTSIVVENDTVKLFNALGKKLTDHPVFTQRKQYNLKVSVFEKYVNVDKGNKEDLVPVTDGNVEIQNFLSLDDTKKTFPISAKGTVDYTFNGGLPNITSGSSGSYTKTMTVLANTGNNGAIHTPWPKDSTYKAYLLGGLPTGNNFVTTGPNYITMILRDPPGTNSTCYMEEGKTVSTTKKFAINAKQEGSGKFTLQFGATVKTFAGVGAGVITETEFDHNVNIGFEHEETWTDENTVAVSTTNTKKWSTSDGSDFVGANGDLFIGYASNIVYGKSIFVSLVSVTDCDGDCVGNEIEGYKIGKSIGMRFNPEFSTAFTYSQNHIENYLIPNLEEIRNSFFKKSDGVYVSKLSTDDPDYGRNNRDTLNKATYFAQNKIDGDSYTLTVPANFPEDSLYVDSVWFYNKQIASWKEVLRRNESEKIKAKLKNNISFDAGAVYEYSFANDSSNTENSSFEFMLTGSLGLELGFTFNKLGTKYELEEKAGGGHTSSDEETHQEVITYGYTLADENEGDYISVDVKNPPSQTGPVFAVRGGQTLCPYEDAVVTKYEQPGKIISEATMQREKPQVEVETAILSEIPEDQTANFRLLLRNLSESGDDAWFSVSVDHTTNQNGANIMIDGAAIGNERLVNVPAGETVEKILSVGKTLDDVNVYENLRVIVSSTCQSDLADSVDISVYFKNVCSAVALTSPGDPWLVNTVSGTKELIGIDGYNLQHTKFNKILFQYKAISSSQWITDNVFYVNQADFDAAQEPKTFINTQASMQHNWDLSSLTDRKYEIRLKSVCVDNTEHESEIHTGTKDMKPPKLFGTPQPGDGILSPNDDIMVSFDETIEAGILTPYNFSVKGVLNGYKKDHNACLYFDGMKAYANVLTGVPLNNKSFTIEFWLKRGSTGAQVIYSQSGNLEIGFDASNKFYAKLGNTTITTLKAHTDQTLWHHWAVAYNKESGLADIYMDDQLLREKMSVADFYLSDGRMIIGKSAQDDRYFNGYLHEFRIWEKALAFSQVYANMYSGFNGKEIGLAGYWPMDAAEGMKAEDLARHRHATLYNAEWRVFPAGKARELNGTSNYVEISTGSTVVILNNMDFTIEIWFKGGKQSNTVLFSNGKAESNENEWLIGVNNEEEIYASNKGLLLTAVGQNFLDNKWHHLALVMNRIGNVSLYIDAVQKATGRGTDFGGLSGAAMSLGARMYTDQGVKHDKFFSGKIDELRIWKLSRELKQIKMDKNSRLTGKEVGLCAYYPFEYYYFNMGVPEIRETLADKYIPQYANYPTGDNAFASGGAFSDDVPNIKDARPVQDVSFDWTVNNDRIVITTNEPNELIENTTLEITVENVEDVNENRLSSPITWTAYINKNQVLWDATELQLSKKLYDAFTFDVDVINLGGKQQNFSIQNLPSWLHVSATEGTLEPDSRQTITFTVEESLNTGKYQESVFLHSDFGFDEKLLINLSVLKPAPDWKVDKNKFQYSMNVIAQLNIDGEISADPDDIVAAFVGNECRGTANLAYFEDYDKFMAFIDVYSNNASGDSVKFRIWDASEGIVRSKVTPSFAFMPNDIKGTVAAPIILSTLDVYDSPIALNKGWNWVSFNLLSDNLKDANTLFSKNRTTGDQVKGPIDSTGNVIFDTYSSASWSKNFFNKGGLKPGYMYMIKTSKVDTIQLEGQKISGNMPYIPIKSGWNWLGYTRLSALTLNDAFAYFGPEDGDLIKSRNAFAMYSNTTGWTGSLKYLKPGEGYMLKTSKTNHLVYPQMAAEQSFMIEKSSKNNTWVVNEPAYPLNMSIIAKVILPDKTEAGEDWTLGVFKGNECRGISNSQTTSNYYLTIFGNGASEELSFKVLNKNNGEKYNIQQKLQYKPDLVMGTPGQPFLLEAVRENGNVSLIKEITYNVSPNPFNDYFKLICKTDEGGILKIEFMNAMGIQLERQQINVISGENQIEWNKAFCSRLSDGVYYLKLTFNNSEKLVRLVKE